jgi:hypothetical protein
MPALRRGAALVALTLCLVPAGAGARADELLVMPYACAMAGGQPVLTPGPEQSHRIIGQRDQRKFSACSPVNPSVCRQWTVHRFDLDCDGTRVSWVSVVAATNEGTRRAWLLDGRLLLRMGPWWSLAPDDPCAREGGPDDAFGSGRLRRQCADRLATAPAPVVELPFGYAPMLGIDGIFVTSAPAIGGTTGTLPPIVAGPNGGRSMGAEATQTTPAPFEPLPTREEPPKEASAKAALPTQTAVPQWQATSKVASAALPAPILTPPAEDAAKPPAVEVKPAPKAVATPQTTVKEAPAKALHKEAEPQGAPLPKTASSSAPPVSEVQKTAADAKPETAAPGTPLKADEWPTAPSRPEAEPETGLGPSLFGVFRATTTGAIVAFSGLALGLIAAFAVVRRRELARDASARRRDVSAVSLDGRRARPSARARDPRGRTAPHGAPTAAAKGAPPAGADTGLETGSGTAAGQGRGEGKGSGLVASGVADWGDRMPRTRDEALEVLGIGIAPSATQAAIKKIVDGLRMSWHPDLAADETDRALRELRSKQINAAWDLLQGQRAEV